MHIVLVSEPRIAQALRALGLRWAGRTYLIALRHAVDRIQEGGIDGYAACPAQIMVGIRADQAIEPATLRQLTGQLIRGEDKVLSPSAAWYRVNIGADGIDHGEIVGCGIRGGIAKRLLLPLHLAYEAFLRKADRLAAYGAGEGKEQRIGARLFDGQGLLPVQGSGNLEGDLPGFARL